ncbi:Flp pilus assembly protein CpaB (plasmid) [Burkholderia humptydooensis]|uniref:Flp pilus assembly protein CpaB n=2 Tax=Burkholderia humptydooensis TaxID=430531 RepID=A0A7U4P829_9BURK|nr:MULTISPECIES: Flp pilus assembly protein CpaB [Burkholderia]AJY38297.1 Flp pilus assembly protein CpaB [Burkholderia sp. 2002721687]ALX44719.1 pilus assembly protein CpaB [Burkholderia humptydooensis]QPS42039.1 Flp pilus assembly protein CpaB [Burkholderia humptydooensis]
MSNIFKLAALTVIAAIGAFVMRGLFIAASRPVPPPAPVMARVRAAAADLPEGLLLRDSDLVWKSVPRDQVPPGAWAEGEPGGSDLKGNLLRHMVREGTPIGAGDVISPNAPGFLAAALKLGMRAISVAIDDVSGNAGLIEPGDYVDVLLTQQLGTSGGPPVPPDHAIVSETVASRVRVLAVGSVFQRPKDDAAQTNSNSNSNSSARARTVTLEVTPFYAQAITLASHLGSLSLALRSFAVSERNPASLAPEAPAPVWAGEVSRAFREVAPRPAARGAATVNPAARGVIVYHGSKAEDAAGGGASGVPPLPSMMPSGATGSATRAPPSAGSSAVPSPQATVTTDSAAAMAAR